MASKDGYRRPRPCRCLLIACCRRRGQSCLDRPASSLIRLPS
jgi:hypothetical protein